MSARQPLTITILAVMLVSFSLAVPGALIAESQQQKEGGSVPVADSSWKYRVRLNKFERQFSTRNDSDHAEWAGFAMVGRGRNKVWLVSKGSTERGDVV